MNKILSKHGKRYTASVKQKASVLRKEGLTHREIARELNIAHSSAWLWTRGMILTPEQKRAVIKRNSKSIFTAERRKRLSELAKVNLMPYWKRPYSKEELVDKIKKFYLEHGRIPLKRDFNMYEEYRQRFGSWNNAIKLAGFEPNPVVFSKKFIAKDGHICDSYAERIVDDWLYKHQIKHERNQYYKGTKMTSDFAIGNIFIEYFGLAGEDKIYDQNILRKREFCQKTALKLIEIYPSDLFPNRLSKIISIRELKEELKR